MILIVAGGRSYRLTPDDLARLDDLARRLPITEVVQAGAPGADAGARAWAISRGLRCTTIPADWGRYGRAAGPIRNEWMCWYAGPGSPVATFPGGRGTAHLRQCAEAAGLVVLQPPRVISPR